MPRKVMSNQPSGTGLPFADENFYLPNRHNRPCSPANKLAGYGYEAH